MSKLSRYYNHLEIFDPLLDFFPELTDGKIYRMVISTELEDHDIIPMCDAEHLCEVLMTEFNELPLVNTVTYNENYLPRNSKIIDFNSEDERFAIVDNLIMMKEEEFSIKDFVLCDNIITLDDDVVCTITTMSADELTKFIKPVTVH